MEKSIAHKDNCYGFQPYEPWKTSKNTTSANSSFYRTLQKKWVNILKVWGLVTMNAEEWALHNQKLAW